MKIKRTPVILEILLSVSPFMVIIPASLLLGCLISFNPWTALIVHLSAGVYNFYFLKTRDRTFKKHLHYRDEGIIFLIACSASGLYGLGATLFRRFIPLIRLRQKCGIKG